MTDRVLVITIIQLALELAMLMQPPLLNLITSRPVVLAQRWHQPIHSQLIHGLPLALRLIHLEATSISKPTPIHTRGQTILSLPANTVLEHARPLILEEICTSRHAAPETLLFGTAPSPESLIAQSKEPLAQNTLSTTC